jgi:trans-aconitate methyltransferase
MDSAEQVAAYAGADFTDSNARFCEQLCNALGDRPAGRLIDLGCGPADICIRLARSLGDWRIDAIDAGENMLEAARLRLEQENLGGRVRLMNARLPDSSLPVHAYQCVVSNSLLHHLPEPRILWQAVADLAAPGAWVQVMDLARPDSAPAADALVENYAGDEPAILKEDFKNSLHAAWRVEEVCEQLRIAGLPLTCKPVSDRHWLVSGRLDRPAGA